MLLSSFLSYLYILEISLLSDVGLVKFFSFSISSRLVLLTVSFALKRLFSLRRSHLLIVNLSVCITGVLLKKLALLPMCSRLFSTFLSCLIYLVLCWGLWSTWTWVLCRVIDMDLFTFFYMRHPVIPGPFVEDVFFSPLYSCGSFVENQVSIGGWIYVWVFYSVLFIHLSVFIPIPSCLYCNRSVVKLGIRDGDTSGSFLFFCTG